MRRILVTGSRKWVDKSTIWGSLRAELEHSYYQFGSGITVVHGGAKGADAIADSWAYGMNAMRWPIEIEVHPADWDTHGKRAGIIRNQEMVDLGANVCYAFPLEDSIGTRHCMSRAMAAGIRVVNLGFQPFTEQAREHAEAYLGTVQKPRREHSL